MKPTTKLDFAALLWFEGQRKARLNDTKGAYSALHKLLASELGITPVRARARLYAIRKGNWNPGTDSDFVAALCRMLELELTDLNPNPKGRGSRGKGKPKPTPDEVPRRASDPVPCPQDEGQDAGVDTEENLADAKDLS